jgi:hypothetical protein
MAKLVGATVRVVRKIGVVDAMAAPSTYHWKLLATERTTQMWYLASTQSNRSSEERGHPVSGRQGSAGTTKKEANHASVVSTVPALLSCALAKARLNTRSLSLYRRKMLLSPRSSPQPEPQIRFEQGIG